jgi:hypothetical protein
MNRSIIIPFVAVVATGCVAAINTSGSPGTATESSLMQADRDFAVATHTRGIDGWMSFYTPDAIPPGKRPVEDATSRCGAVKEGAGSSSWTPATLSR